MIVYNLADSSTALVLTMAFASRESNKRYLFFAENIGPEGRGFISESFLDADVDESVHIDMFLDYLARAQGDPDDEEYE